MGGSSAAVTTVTTSLASDEFCNAHTLLARGSSSQSLSAGALAPHSRRCAACSTAAAECAGYPKNESEVVPVAVVVHLVDVHVWVEQRHHERDRADQPLPQTQPETGRFRVRSRPGRWMPSRFMALPVHSVALILPGRDRTRNEIATNLASNVIPLTKG